MQGSQFMEDLNAVVSNEKWQRRQMSFDINPHAWY